MFRSERDKTGGPVIAPRGLLEGRLAEGALPIHGGLRRRMLRGFSGAREEKPVEGISGARRGSSVPVRPALMMTAAVLPRPLGTRAGPLRESPEEQFNRQRHELYALNTLLKALHARQSTRQEPGGV